MENLRGEKNDQRKASRFVHYHELTFSMASWAMKISIQGNKMTPAVKQIKRTAVESEKNRENEPFTVFC